MAPGVRLHQCATRGEHLEALEPGHGAFLPGLPGLSMMLGEVEYRGRLRATHSSLKTMIQKVDDTRMFQIQRSDWLERPIFPGMPADVNEMMVLPADVGLRLSCEHFPGDSHPGVLELKGGLPSPMQMRIGQPFLGTICLGLEGGWDVG